MFILDVASNCNNYAIVSLFVIAKRIFTIIQILAPILAIIGLGINLVKSVIDPENKKNFSHYKNWLHALEPPKEWSGDLLDDWGIIKAQESEEKNG